MLTGSWLERDFIGQNVKSVNMSQKETVYNCRMKLIESVKGHKYMMLFKRNTYQKLWQINLPATTYKLVNPYCISRIDMSRHLPKWVSYFVMGLWAV